ncbi:hypothetical protein ABID52_000559 [Fictibacillus halophilus]|uniref:Heparinase II/III-like protein n=1 Tax=Fictibacillus halophilus TaxID=1610490 RepID=A0ABV2LHM2_9BACL|nr:heparinase II/III family protein [Fictibacillus halophilus]
MRKKIQVNLIIVFTLVTLFITTTVFSSKEIKLMVNGSTVQLSNEPVWKGSTLWMPIDDSFRSLGFRVAWDTSNQYATISHRNDTFVLKLNSDSAVVNGKAITLSEKIQKIGKTPMISKEIFEDLTHLRIESDMEKNKITFQSNEVNYNLTSTKRVAVGDYLEFFIHVKNQGTKKNTYKLEIPSEFKDILKTDVQTIILLPDSEGTFIVSSMQKVTMGQNNKLYVRVADSSSNQSDVSLNYEAVDYSLAKHKHPNSFIGSSQLERAKQRIKKEQWANNYWKYIEKEANRWLNAKITVPMGYAGHPSWYVCKDGSSLTFDKGKHVCKSENSTYYGGKFDAGLNYYKHNEATQALKNLSVAYALSGNSNYGSEAIRILNDYADAYPMYPLQSRGGRMFWQSLDESVAMVDIIQSYDLLYNHSEFSDEAKRNVELNLIRPSIESITSYSVGRSNWQAWHNAAIGMAGAVLGDRQLLQQAVYGKEGFEYLMENGVESDGFWWEGSIAYHAYTLAPLNILAETAAKWDYNLFLNENFKKMFDTPLLYAYPNLTLPSNNDGGSYGASLINSFSSKGYYDYESAYTNYKDSKYAWLMNEKYKTLYRRGDFALFFGEDSILPSTYSGIRSSNFKDVGHGILRSDTPNSVDQLYTLMDYGPHGGSHGHLDKLGIDLFGVGKNLAPDFGTPAYSHPLYRTWYKQTIGHNTVVVDGKPQQETTGNMVSFIDTKTFKYMYAEANEAYDIKYSRAIWMNNDYVVDWFQVSDPKKKHSYDWFLHGLGKLATDVKTWSANSKSLFGYSSNGYEHLKDVSTVKSNSTWNATFNDGGSGLRVISIPTSNNGKLIRATGPGPSTQPNQLSPILIERQNGNEANFLKIYQPYKNNSSASIKGYKETSNSVRVDLKNQSHFYYLNYLDMKRGQLLSARGVIDPKVKVNIEEEMKSKINKDSLHLEFKGIDRFKTIDLLFYAPDIKSVYVNGQNTDYTKEENNQVLITYLTTQ